MTIDREWTYNQLVVAGVHESKNEIAARIGHFKLSTETPISEQISKAIAVLEKDPTYKTNVQRLKEFTEYPVNNLFADYVNHIVSSVKQTLV